MTESPLKSPTSDAPAARSRSPPKPVMTVVGLGAQQLGRQRAGVEIAGRLAARDHHAHGCGVRGDQLGLTKSVASSGTLTS